MGKPAAGVKAGALVEVVFLTVLREGVEWRSWGRKCLPPCERRGYKENRWEIEGKGRRAVLGVLL